MDLPPGVTGVGIDAVEVDAPAAPARAPAAGLRPPLLGPGARYADGYADPFPRYAARFAAKEAVGKALGIGIIGFVWREIEVLSGGKPRVALHGHVAQIARRLGVTRVELSLSHTGGMAYAMAVAVRDAAGPRAGAGRDEHDAVGADAGAGFTEGEGR